MSQAPAELETNLVELAQWTGNNLKALRMLINGNLADLSSLPTQAKGNLLAAISEIFGLLEDLSAGAAGIDDGATSASSTWSSTKTQQMIDAGRDAAVAMVVGGAPEIANTIAELKALMESGDAADQSAIALLQGALGDKANKSEVWSKAEIGDINRDLVAVGTAALA